VENHRRGNLQEFVDIYGLILTKVPDYAEGHNNRAVVLQQMQQYEQALAGYDQAIALKPGYANAHFNRGTVLRKLARPNEAIASYDRAIALNPGHAEAYNNRGVVLQDLKRYDEALASYDQAIALKPGYVEAINNRGIVLASKGDMAAAEEMFVKASSLRPEFPDPLFNLANIRTYSSPDHPEIANIKALLLRSDISPETEEHLHFSLGKIYDDCGHYEEAFEHFRKANEIRNRQVAYDAALVEKMTEATIATFTRDFLASQRPFSSQSRRPLFIVGMPRSGTTLLASILSNHPAIGTAGELSTLGDFALQLPELAKGNEPYPAAVRTMTADIAQHITSGYEARLCRDFPATVAYIIDKNPLNFRYIGFISMLFPEARILHCTRQPAATCLSNYFQRFPLHLDYSFDLRNIGHFYREYARLMDHWRQIPSLKLIDVSYEEMILNTEKVARTVLDFLGLEWDARCLSPHTNKYPVETASHWQVRQPIYQKSLANWRHYEKHLGPLAEMLPSALDGEPID